MDETVMSCTSHNTKLLKTIFCLGLEAGSVPPAPFRARAALLRSHVLFKQAKRRVRRARRVLAASRPPGTLPLAYLMTRENVNVPLLPAASNEIVSVYLVALTVATEPEPESLGEPEASV